MYSRIMMSLYFVINVAQAVILGKLVLFHGVLVCDSEYWFYFSLAGYNIFVGFWTDNLSVTATFPVTNDIQLTSQHLFSVTL